MARIKNSIILSYKEIDEDRKFNLQTILPFLYKLLDGKTEIILVEQNFVSTFKLSEQKDQINHIFLYNNKIFNKGLGYNVGAKNAKGDNLIFNDIDLFLKIESYWKSLSFLENFDVVDPYDKLYYLNKIETKDFINNNYDFNITKTIENPVISKVISGGIFMIKKESFLSIKGFDEMCYGYGHEDDIFDIKIKEMGLKVKKINDDAIHAHHKINKNFYNKYYSRKEENKKLFHEYQNMNSDQIKEKTKNTTIWGGI